MDLIHALIISVVEGVTEFLPISSTGHQILVAKLLSVPQTEFVKTFEIFIQLGAILAVCLIYWRKFLQSQKIWISVLVAFIPTAIIGFALYKIIKNVLLGNLIVTVLALFIGGILLIFLEKMHQEKQSQTSKVEQMTLKQAIGVGLVQSLSIIPGVSRSAASILGGMYLGLKRETAVEFSFLLAIPTMLAATGLDLVKTHLSFSSSEYVTLAVGFIGAFVTALLVIRWFLKYIQKNSFVPFGVYRIILAVLFWLIFLR